MTIHAHTPAIAGRHVNTLVGYVFGAVFVLIGLAGFTVSDGHHAVGQDGGELLGLFQVNVLHNIVHLAIGAVMIAAAAAGALAAKRTNMIMGIAYLAVFLAGLFVIGTEANIIALNSADNVLHLALGLILVAVGLMTDRNLDSGREPMS